MSEIRQLDLDLIIVDQDIQTREVTDSQQLELFEELYRDAATVLPPVVVFHDADGVFWLADGHYRFLAAKEALSTEGPRSIPAEIHEGSKRDAVFYAAGANKHGKPLTNEEKRTVVQRLLKDPVWSQQSNREIARHTGTSHVFVGIIRTELEDQAAASGNGYQIPADKDRIVQVRRRSTRYPMRTGSIGHSPAVPVAPPANTDTTAPNGMERIVTENLHDLMNAWRKASPAARRTFREWVNKQPSEEYAGIVSTEETKRNNSIIAEVCRTLEGDTP
jgi:hypothetical protein